MGGWGAALKGAGALFGSNPEMAVKGIKLIGKAAIVVPMAGYAGWKVFGKGEGLDEVAVGVCICIGGQELCGHGGVQCGLCRQMRNPCTNQSNVPRRNV